MGCSSSVISARYCGSWQRQHIVEKNVWRLPGNSFYLVCGFKVTEGNGFQDSISQPSQRAITDTQVVSLSLSFLSRHVTTFVQLLARTLTTKSQLMLMFLLLCQSRLAMICMSATLVSPVMRQAFYKGNIGWPSFIFLLVSASKGEILVDV